MEVYRLTVPNVAGEYFGPYRVGAGNVSDELGELIERMEDDHSLRSNATHPVLFAAREDARYGCVSEAKLIEWFGEYLDELYSVGARIETHTITSDKIIAQDDYQIVWSTADE